MANANKAMKNSKPFEWYQSPKGVKILTFSLPYPLGRLNGTNDLAILPLTTRSIRYAKKIESLQGNYAIDFPHISKKREIENLRTLMKNQWNKLEHLGNRYNYFSSAYLASHVKEPFPALKSLALNFVCFLTWEKNFDV